ncbi:hypothetical protein HanHA300_Chr09g0343121 [Helianthus annuus]|nr:hypothetical protein HanHA300_Chr09g0343121 [Helianthus annuus]KAJ0544685.1 hypothetical protein HanHA89_Chr09g0364361 [Helianthus annuus]KAJ0709688.1 hypothetical protein HanLR1_Chr09g0343081 [Helianthus annuus]KAJ0713561.1 hypothetical protein HanOQP8_Chr09g0347181 [Helianthus annuus]
MAKAQRYRERKLFGCNGYDSLLRIIFSEADDHKILREKKTIPSCLSSSANVIIINKAGGTPSEYV